jgi:hypothetical protein
MHNATDHAAVIDPMSAFAATRQQWFDPSPFRIAQPVDLFF